MIAGFFHQGSGLGDQLFRYITVRTLAEEKVYEWSMLQQNFKGDFFKEQPKQLGGDYKPGIQFSLFHEKDVRDGQGNDIRSYDPEINFVEDNTIIDGSFEDDKYWRHNLDNINKWLEVEPIYIPDTTCVIGFRGGEYATVPELFLPKSYYDTSIKIMHSQHITDFEVHTDDPALARQFFPDFRIIENTPLSHSKHSNMGLNWRSMRYAKYAIIPNSAFFILPRILKHHEDPEAVTVAPRYWAGRNTRVWKRPACFYREFRYI